MDWWHETESDHFKLLLLKVVHQAISHFCNFHLAFVQLLFIWSWDLTLTSDKYQMIIYYVLIHKTLDLKECGLSFSHGCVCVCVHKCVNNWKLPEIIAYSSSLETVPLSCCLVILNPGTPSHSLYNAITCETHHTLQPKSLTSFFLNFALRLFIAVQWSWHSRISAKI